MWDDLAKEEADQKVGVKPAKEVSLWGLESLLKAAKAAEALPLVLSREPASERAPRVYECV